MRMLQNVKDGFPENYWTWTVTTRDPDIILKELCHSEKVDKMLPAMSALKAAISLCAPFFQSLGAGGIPAKIVRDADALHEKAKILIAIRAASTVTLIKLKDPEVQGRPRSVSAIMRECKRLIAALGVTVPAIVMSCLEEAAATASEAEPIDS